MKGDSTDQKRMNKTLLNGKLGGALLMVLEDDLSG